MNNAEFEKLNQKIRAYIRYIDTADEYIYIRSSNDLREIEINDNLDRLFGCFNAKTANIKINNPIISGNYKYLISDKDVELYIGYEDTEGIIHYSDKGTYRVTKTNSETVGGGTSFTLQDLSILFDKVCTLTFEYPITRLNIVQAICTELGITLATSSFWQCGEIVTSQFWTNGTTYREIIRIIAEASLCFAKIGDDNQLYIKFYELTNYILKPKSYKTLNVEKQYGVINSVVLARTDESGSCDFDVIRADDTQSIADNGKTEIKISNNPLLNEDRITYAPILLEHINGFSYFPFTSEMVLGNYLMEHNIITIRDKDNIDRRTIVLNINQKFNGSMKTSIETTAPSKTKQEYKGAGKIGEQIKNVWINVDKINGNITLLNEDITDQERRIAVLEIFNNSIKTTIEESGSDNQISNSVGYAWETIGGVDVPKFWIVNSGTVGFIENDWTRINTLALRAWQLETCCFEQEIPTVTGNEYNISLIARKLNALGSVSVVLQNVENIIIYDETKENGKYEYSFVARGNSVKLIITANNTLAYLSDLILNTGNSKQQWKQASGELYTANTLFDKDGVIIKNNVYNGYTRISPSEFAGYYEVNGVMKRVFTLNKDTTEVTKLQVDESVEFGNENCNVLTKMIVVTDGLDIVIVDREVV